MPQLDKYIFFNHVVSLSFFFWLIYIFIRGAAVPQLSGLLKYRKKRLDFFSKELSQFEIKLNFSKTKYETKGKNLLTKSLVRFNKLSDTLYNRIHIGIKSTFIKVYNTLFKGKKKVFLFNSLSNNEFTRLNS